MKSKEESESKSVGVEYLGKSLFVGGSVLVLSDLHLGYGGALENSGVMVQVNVYQEIFRELESIFEKIGRVKKVILLGDVKHDMGHVSKQEWREVSSLLEYLKGKSEEIVIVKGNHDNIIAPLVNGKEIVMTNVYLWEDFAFFHGDKDFEELYDAKVKNWVLGHMHPAVDLVSGAKSERYKCFLNGAYKGKNVIIMPSFFPFSEGSDPRDQGKNAWDFKFDNFKAIVVGEDLETFEFGKLKNLN